MRAFSVSVSGAEDKTVIRVPAFMEADKKQKSKKTTRQNHWKSYKNSQEKRKSWVIGRE